MSECSFCNGNRVWPMIHNYEMFNLHFKYWTSEHNIPRYYNRSNFNFPNNKGLTFMRDSERMYGLGHRNGNYVKTGLPHVRFNSHYIRGFKSGV